MKFKHSQERKRVTIYPGEFYASTREITISTLLGSCVAACLYDPVNRVIGMNHFLLSGELYSNDQEMWVIPSGRYGVHAMELLINKMLKLGASRKHIQAKAFGGATLKGFGNSLTNKQSIGRTNALFIRQFLNMESIPLIAEAMGGSQGRTIYFVSSDYSVYVKNHNHVNLQELFQQENTYIQLLRQQLLEKSDIDLWD